MYFIEEVVAKANRAQKTLTGDFAQVETLVAAHDLVIAVWKDPKGRSGVSTMIIKGESVLSNVVRTDKAQEMSWIAIPCTSAAQAEALRRAPPKPANDRR